MPCGISNYNTISIKLAISISHNEIIMIIIYYDYDNHHNLKVPGIGNHSYISF